MILNIKEVAEKAGVSITTVSRVLNNPQTVSKKTKEKVLQVMDDLNYTPNWFARNLQNKRTNVIGVLVPDTLEPSNMEMTKGVEKVARQKGCNLILCNTEFDQSIESEHITNLVERKIDGLILTSSVLDESQVKKIREKKIPFVLVGKTPFWEKENVVYTNYDSAAEEAVSYLIEKGRRHIAIILTEHAKIDNEEKLAGYKRALERHNLKIEESYIVKSDNTLEGGYIATSKLIETSRPLDAIFIATDTMAFGALEKIKQENLTPDQLAIIGFDDLKVGAVMEPKLTTVTKPSYRIGLTAARLLFDLIEYEGQGEEQQAIMLKSRLKIRKSCGNKERLKEIW